MTEPQTDHDRNLQVLLLDYEMARDDDRTVVTTQAAAFSILIAIVGLLIAAISQTCKFQTAKDRRDCTEIPDLMLAGLPLVPLTMLAFILLFGMIATLRSYYLRGLEAELQRYTRGPMTALGELPPASYTSFVLTLASQRRGRLGYRLLAGVVLLGILVIFGGLTLYIALTIDRGPRILMGLVYIPLGLLLLSEARAASVGGKSLFMSTAESYLRRGNSGDLPRVHGFRDHRDSERTLSSYLLMPRPEDAIKVLFAPGAFVVFAATLGSFGRWAEFLLLWMVLELMVYHARYQLNDVRDVNEDSTHAERGSRARLPLGQTPADTRRNVIASVTTAGIRIALAVALGLAFGLTSEVFILIGAVFGIAVVYEALRSRDSEYVTTSAGWRERAIWMVVGLGYAVRAALGFTTAGVAIDEPPALIGMAFFAALGSMFVLLTWVLEATSYCKTKSDTDGPSWLARKGLRSKPHVAALLGVPAQVEMDARNRYLHNGPTALEKTPEAVDSEMLAYRGREPILEERGALWTPWNVALIVSAASGGLLATYLVPEPPTDVGATVAILFATTGGAALLIVGRNSRHRWLVAVAVAVGLAVSGALLSGHGRFAVLALPWLVTALCYAGFRGSSYANLKYPYRKAREVIAAAGDRFLRIVVGQRTWRVVDLRSERDDRQAAALHADRCE